MGDTSDEKFLNNVITECANNTKLLPDAYNRLISLFVPGLEHSIKAKAFVALSSICSRHRHLPTAEVDEAGTHNIVHLFLPFIESRLSEVEERPLLEAFSFVGALFSVDWQSGAAIFNRDGFQDTMMDALELYASSSELMHTVASVLASACGFKPSRSNLSSRCIIWLDSTFKHTKDEKVKAAVTLALLKSQTTGNSSELNIPSNEETDVKEREENLFDSLRNILVNSGEHLNHATDAVEGLTYLSTKPHFKNRIVDDNELLKKIISTHRQFKRNPSQPEHFGTMPFGVAALVANLCSYRLRLSEEQAQIERLKKMASGSKSNNKATTTDYDDDEYVRKRGKRLIDLGVVDLLVSITKVTDSSATKSVVGRALLGLIEDKNNRGKILQAGGGKTLMSIIRASHKPKSEESTSELGKAGMEFADLDSIQAMAKLAITASPLQVFGPDTNVSIEAIKPLAYLLLHPSSSLLQQFESMMALTNISSMGPDLATRVTQTEGILSKLEFLLLSENNMIRRAATELICNLVSGSEDAFNRFSGEGDSTTHNQAKSRLHILFALADVDDEPTNLAASGALAILTSSASASKLILELEFEHHRAFRILKQLIHTSTDEGDEETEPKESNLGLVHRGVVCVRNVLVNLSSASERERLASDLVECGMVDGLTGVIKRAGNESISEDILRPTAEALKWLMDFGVNVLA